MVSLLHILYEVRIIEAVMCYTVDVSFGCCVFVFGKFSEIQTLQILFSIRKAFSKSNFSRYT